MAEFFLTRLSERARIPYKDVVDTKSNLSFGVFMEIIEMLNLDSTPYLAQETMLDQKLLNTRNTIAHGRYLLVDFDDYFKIHDEIISMITFFKNQLENAAFTDAYRRV